MTPGGKEEPVWWEFTRMANGGYWETDADFKCPKMELLVKDFLRSVLGVKDIDAPKSFVQGSSAHQTYLRLPYHLNRGGEFFAMMDGDLSRNFILFKCGWAWSCAEHKLVSSQPEHYASLHTGYDFPLDDFVKVETCLRENNIDVEAIFRTIRDMETEPNVSEYPEGIVADLDKMASLEPFTTLALMRDSFTLPGSSSDWAVTLFRVVKVPAAGAFPTTGWRVATARTCGGLGSGSSSNTMRRR